MSVYPSYQVDAHKGHKVDARGLLYREDDYGELNLTSLLMVAPTCAK